MAGKFHTAQNDHNIMTPARGQTRDLGTKSTGIAHKIQGFGIQMSRREALGGPQQQARPRKIRSPQNDPQVTAHMDEATRGLGTIPAKIAKEIPGFGIPQPGREVLRGPQQKAGPEKIQSPQNDPQVTAPTDEATTGLGTIPAKIVKKIPGFGIPQPGREVLRGSHHLTSLQKSRTPQNDPQAMAPTGEATRGPGTASARSDRKIQRSGLAALGRAHQKRSQHQGRLPGKK